MSQEVAILDIGSSRMTVMIGRRGINNTINILGKGECEYAGYENGEFYRPEELINVVARAIEDAENDARMKIRHIFIGVPGQFSVTQCKDVTMSLNRKRKVTEEDVDELFAMGNNFADSDKFLIKISGTDVSSLTDELIIAWDNLTFKTDFTEDDFEATYFEGYEAIFNIKDDGLYLSYIAVPEPAAFAAIFGALSLAFCIRLRRK